MTRGSAGKMVLKMRRQQAVMIRVKSCNVFELRCCESEDGHYQYCVGLVYDASGLVRPASGRVHSSVNCRHKAVTSTSFSFVIKWQRANMKGSIYSTTFFYEMTMIHGQSIGTKQQCMRRYISIVASYAIMRKCSKTSRLKLPKPNCRGIYQRHEKPIFC